MPKRCILVDMPGGPPWWVCGTFPAEEMCPCGSGRLVEFLCDYRASGRKRTCSRKMCTQCAFEVDPERHLCKEHRPLPGTQEVPMGPEKSQEQELPILACGCAGY